MTDDGRPPTADKRMTTDKRTLASVVRRRSAVGLLALITLLVAGAAAGGPAERPAAVASGGGEYVVGEADRMSDAERAEIMAMLAANTARLSATGLLPAPDPRASAQAALDWPLRPRAGFDDPGYHAVSGFMDHNPAFPNQRLDYACGGRTYDSPSGYNHQGTDFFMWPFAWNKMDAGDVEVVAAAPGVIIGRSDGNFDRSCTLNGNKWNAVYVLHADGSVAWYGHLKRNSLTTKGLDATVAAGEYLGTVGSSGNSTGPHLHFELYDNGTLIDPYFGECNQLPGGSWWIQQRNYYDSAINRLATGTKAPTWGSCPNPDTPNEATQFQPGDRVTFLAYYRDLVAGKPTAFRIIQPDGSLFTQWSHAIAQPHYTTSYWWWAYNLPADAPAGAWQFEADFNGTTSRHTFHVGPAVTPTPTPIAPAWKGFVPIIMASDE